MKTIYLLRHGESESNVDKDILSYKANALVNLTYNGTQQASLAADKLLEMGVESAQFFVSPYVRTLETFEQIKTKVKCIKYNEDYRLREIDVGNFISNWRKIAQERLQYGSKFFYRFPDGESCADVALRVKSFLDEYKNKLTTGYPNVIVTHAATMRLFQFVVNKLSVKEFEILHKPKNCEIIKLEYYE